MRGLSDPYPVPGETRPSSEERWIFFKTREEAETFVRSLRGLADRLESGEADIQLERARE